MVVPIAMPTLAHALVTAPGATPSRWLLFLHGIFGTGGNWRTFARRLVTARPDWGAALVDLRMHGASQDFDRPHTLDAAADDLVALDAHIPGRVDAVLGHSFGGKVALAYVDRRAGQLEQAWILDAMPGARTDARGSEETVGVVRWLERAERTFASRDAFVQSMVDAGFERELSQWLAMNLRHSGEQYVFRLDLGAIRALLDDYFQRDLWPMLESPPGRARFHVVIGGRSPVFSPADRARVETIAADSGGRVRVHVLQDAGHWVHVDDPEGLYREVIAAIPP
jgi:pimeloyl-ACP methyl ester carboxylesterase